MAAGFSARGKRTTRVHSATSSKRRRNWQKDDKVWMELAPEQFDQPYFFSVNLSRGLGEKFFFAGLMRDSDLVLFRKQGQQVQLTAINAYFFAQPKTPQALGVRESFSDSLISSVPIVSQPHPAVSYTHLTLPTNREV